MPCTQIALFPLSAHLMPGGVMSLRIFEARYIRMVKQACVDERQFGMCMLNPEGDKHKNHHIYPIGTLAKVIDFETLADGLLGIKVEGVKNFEIQTIQTEYDDLRVGHVKWIEHWDGELIPEEIAPLCAKLKEIFLMYPEFTSLYLDPQFDHDDWVLFRWLELLPVDVDVKQSLIMSKSYTHLCDYINRWVSSG